MVTDYHCTDRTSSNRAIKELVVWYPTQYPGRLRGLLCNSQAGYVQGGVGRTCIRTGIRDGKRRKILFQAYFKPRPISSLINQFWDDAVVRIKR